MQKKTLFSPLSALVLFIGMSVFLTACTLQAGVPRVTAGPDSRGTEGLVYALNDAKTEYAVASIGTAQENEIYIPKTYNGLPVTSIGESAFFECYFIRSVTIPDSVKSIGKSAFSRCFALKSVSLSEGVTTIGDSAFMGCSGLRDILLPDSVTTIEHAAFSACAQLTSITIPEKVTRIEEEAFSGCLRLTNVKLPDGLNSIGKNAFADCLRLTSITIPSPLTVIEESAFEACVNLVEVYNFSALSIAKASSANGGIAYYADDVYTSPEAESKLSTDENGFVIYNKGTGKILLSYIGTASEIQIPVGVTSIAPYAFAHCPELTHVTVGKTVTKIGECAFMLSYGLVSVTIPKHVTSIGDYAFLGCMKLVEVYNFSDLSRWDFLYSCVTMFALDLYSSPDAQSKLSTDANGLVIRADGDQKTLISYVGSEENVTIPDGIAAIGDWAFYASYTLKEVMIGKDVTSIGDSAFAECYGLRSVRILGNVTSIGESAFSGCRALTNITFMGTMAQWKAI